MLCSLGCGAGIGVISRDLAIATEPLDNPDHIMPVHLQLSEVDRIPGTVAAEPPFASLIEPFEGKERQCPCLDYQVLLLPYRTVRGSRR